MTPFFSIIIPTYNRASLITHTLNSVLNQTFKNLIIYFRSAFVYWIVSLTGIALLYYIFKDQKMFNALFFSFLAAITFPHVIVILKMFRNK